MAVVKVVKASRLVIKVEDGATSAGKTVYRQRAYRNVKIDAAEADVFAVGQALAALQSHPVAGIGRVDEGDFLNQ